MLAKVAERGQVVIPKKLRDSLGIKAGTVLDFVSEGGQLIARKKVEQSPWDSNYGALADGRDTDSVMNELRDPVK